MGEKECKREDLDRAQHNGSTVEKREREREREIRRGKEIHKRLN